MSSRRSKARGPLRAVNGTDDGFRVPKLKLEKPQSLPEQSCTNETLGCVAAVAEAAKTDENMTLSQQNTAAASEDPAQWKQVNAEAPEPKAAVQFSSFEEIFTWDWCRMQQELKQLCSSMQPTSPAAAYFLRRCILRIDVLMELPPQSDAEDDNGVQHAVDSEQEKAKCAVNVRADNQGDEEPSQMFVQENLQPQATRTTEPSPTRSSEMEQAFALVDPSNNGSNLFTPGCKSKEENNLDSNAAITDTKMNCNGQLKDSAARTYDITANTNGADFYDASPTTRGTMFDGEDDDKPVRSRARKTNRKQPKEKPIARRRSLRVAKVTQRYDDEDNENNASAQARKGTKSQPDARACTEPNTVDKPSSSILDGTPSDGMPGTSNSPVKTTEETTPYRAPSHEHFPRTSDSSEQNNHNNEDSASVELSPASSDGGLASVMNSLTLADSMVTSVVHGTPCDRESARKPKVKRLRLNSTVGKTTMAAFETPSRTRGDAPRSGIRNQKRGRSKTDVPLLSSPSTVDQPEQDAGSPSQNGVLMETLNVNVTLSDALSFLPQNSARDDLTSGIVIWMFSAAAATLLCDQPNNATKLQAIIDQYWQVCQRSGSDQIRLSSQSSLPPATAAGEPAKEKKKKKSVRFCADVAGVCPINDREIDTVNNVSNTMSSLEQYLQMLRAYRDDNSLQEACETLVQALTQVSNRSTPLYRQFEQVATELLKDNHSATFATETASEVAAELKNFPMGIQRPIHYRLTWLCSSAIRYHLRFLFDPPPPSASMPAVTGYQPVDNCRSSLHEIIYLDQPTPAQAWIQCTGSDTKPEWALSSSVIHALWQLHTALNRVAPTDHFEPGKPVPAIGNWMQALSEKLTVQWVDDSTGVERVWRAQSLMAAEISREFLLHVFTHENVTAAAEESQVYGELEQCARMLLRAEGMHGEDGPLVLLSHISELLSALRHSLCLSSDIQQFRTLLAQHRGICGPRPTKKKLAELRLTPSDAKDVACLLVDSPFVFEYPTIVVGDWS